MNRARQHRVCLWALAVVTAFVWMTAGAAGATAAPGRRVTVGLFGDSVTESIVVPDFRRYGLAPQLADAASSYGFTPGAAGLIPASQFDWRFNAFGVYGLQPVPADGWALVGDQSGSRVQPGYDGPAGYSAVTGAQQATASVVVSDPDIDVLYTSTPAPCEFTVTAAGRSWTIDTYQAGPARAAEAALVLPRGRHRLTVHGPSCRFEILSGVVARRPVAPGRVQLEVDNLGHAGRLPWTDLQPRVEQSIVEQRYDISVFLYGYIGELLASPGSFERQYSDALLTRARLAREHGGSCLIVAPTPLPVSGSAAGIISRLERKVARRGHCRYTTVLTHLWRSPDAAMNRGLVAVDGVHPTAAGYRLIARALAPVIAQMARPYARLARP